MAQKIEGTQQPRWENGLTDIGRELLKGARMKCVDEAMELMRQEYFVVAEVLSNSGRLVWTGPKDRVGGYRIAVGIDEITRAKEIDSILGRRRKYRVTDGAVMPLKKFLRNPEGITIRRHLRRDRYGMTIWAKELQLEADIEREEAVAERERELTPLEISAVQRDIAAQPIFVFT